MLTTTHCDGKQTTLKAKLLNEHYFVGLGWVCCRRRRRWFGVCVSVVSAQIFITYYNFVSARNFGIG